MDIGAGAYLVVVVGFTVIGGGSGSGGSWGWRREGEDMFGGGAVLEYVAEGIQRFGCGWALVVEMWAEEGIDCCEYGVSVDEEGLQGVRELLGRLFIRCVVAGLP